MQRNRVLAAFGKMLGEMTNMRVIVVVVLGVGLLAHPPSGRGQDTKSIFQVVKTPNHQGLYSNYLFAASASSPSDIWAVGLTAIHFDGTTWTDYPLPGIDGQIGHQLYGVAAISPTNAWGVGTFATSGTTNGNLQHWDGSTWSGSPSAPGEEGEPLQSITAISATDIWAGGCIPAFFEHFNGTKWTVVPSPGVSEVNESCITGISVISTNDVWAVGWNQPTGDIGINLTEHWDGAKWEIISTPNVGTGNNQLNGVVALASNDVWAVGFSTAKPDTGIEYPNQTLIEHWDGSSWTVVSSPNLRVGGLARDNELQGIVAVSPNDLWAFGWVGVNPNSGSFDSYTVVLHGDGTSWSIVPSPNPSGNSVVNDALYGGVVTAPGSVWLVGYQSRKSPLPQGTLVLHTTGG